MELRHLRCFVVLAEELSRAIKALEDELGVVLLIGIAGGTRLTAAGAAFLQDARRLFAFLEQARENVKAVAAGLR